MLNYRTYDSARDQQAAMRIWQEVGWMHDDRTAALDRFITSGRAWVADLQGEAECLVLATPGDLRYQDETLPFSCIAGVTTSRIARKQGFAARLTAHAVAHEAAAGAVVCGLGMFEQGFYNRLGFGSGCYEHHVSLNPGQITVPGSFRVPERFTEQDWEALHAARLRRLRLHGSVSITAPEFTMNRLNWGRDGFGLGYRDEPDGGFSHLVYCSNTHNEHGPYHVGYLVYQTSEQFRELLALLRSLGDQVYSLSVTEPTHIQLQDFLKQPFTQHSLTASGDYPVKIGAWAWWQMRICDLGAALAQTHLAGRAVRFNLQLADPITDLLGAEETWRGSAGEYVVTLGEESAAVPGSDPALPTLETTVNAFTRLWLGVRPASGLAVTDHLLAPPELLADLDRLVRLPRPRPDWDL